MKRIKQYIMFGAAALMTASCSDFLDTTPYDALSPSTTWRLNRMPRNLPSDAIPDGKTEDVCFTWTVHLTLVTTIFPGKDTKTWPTVI